MTKMATVNAAAGDGRRRREGLGMVEGLRAAARALEAEGVFTGGPVAAFARVGRNQLIVALDQGLGPEARVLDVGCGALRGGWWLVRFLAPARYHGIEPNAAMLEAGRRLVLGPALEADKRPRFATNADFDFGVFGARFDMVLARSIWSHAAFAQIEAMLDGFVAHAAAGGVMLASYREASAEEPPHRGAHWVGRSHESDVGGMVTHRLADIRAAARARGLGVQPLYTDFGQTWLRVRRTGDPDPLRGEPRAGIRHWERPAR